MKRIALMLVLALASGLAAHGIYSVARPEKSPEVCTMEWLARELQLSPEQGDAVWAIHARRCAEICRLDGERMQCTPETAMQVEKACRFATGQLIAEVCAQLTPAQREKYLRIVAPCLQATRAH